MINIYKKEILEDLLNYLEFEKINRLFDSKSTQDDIIFICNMIREVKINLSLI